MSNPDIFRLNRANSPLRAAFRILVVTLRNLMPPAPPFLLFLLSKLLSYTIPAVIMAQIQQEISGLTATEGARLFAGTAYNTTNNIT